MKKLILCLFIAFTLPAAAQSPIPEFGKIDKADLLLTSCPFESSASALKLLELQEIEFDYDNYGSKLVTEKRVRIKVFNEKGYKHATIRIPYYSKRRVTRIKDLEAIVYNLDGAGNITTERLDKKDFFKEKTEDNIGIINFTFPNLKPGSVVEFRYRKIEKDIARLDPWILQDEIPVRQAVCFLTTPNTSRVYEKVVGADTIEQKKEFPETRSARFVKRIYSRENIPSFRYEPFMSSVKDNLLKVIFILIPHATFATDLMTPKVRWEIFGKTIYHSPFIEGQLKKNLKGTESLIDSAKKISHIAERIRYLYEQVQKQIPERGEQTAFPDDIADTWVSHYGSSAETNLALLNLLQKAGIPAQPLLVSTRENGRINTEFPSPGQLNGLDVFVRDNAEYYVMDASLKYQSPFVPPYNILNREALLLSDEDVEWVTITDNRPLLKSLVNVTALFTDSGYIQGSAYNIFYDYYKSMMLDSTSEDDKKNYFNKKPDGLKMLSTTFENTQNDNQPLIQKLEFDYTGPNTGNYYFINPQFLMTTNSNPFVQTTRHTDIDLGSRQELILKINLEFPDSLYSVDFIPSNILVRAPDSSFMYRRIVTQEKGRVSYYQSFEINYPIFYKEDYPGVKEFFDRVYALMAEEIVLKKK